MALRTITHMLNRRSFEQTPVRASRAPYRCTSLHPPYDDAVSFRASASPADRTQSRRLKFGVCASKVQRGSTLPNMRCHVCASTFSRGRPGLTHRLQISETIGGTRPSPRRRAGSVAIHDGGGGGGDGTHPVESGSGSDLEVQNRGDFPLTSRHNLTHPLTPRGVQGG